MWPPPDRLRCLVVTLGQNFICTCTAYPVVICTPNTPGGSMELQSTLPQGPRGRAGSAVPFRTSDGRKTHSILRYRVSLSRTDGDGLPALDSPFTYFPGKPAAFH